MLTGSSIASANLVYLLGVGAPDAGLTEFSGGEQQAIASAANSLREDFLRSLVNLPRAATPLERAGACIEFLHLAEGCRWIQRSPLRTELLQGLASMLMYETTAAVRQLIHAAIHALKVDHPCSLQLPGEESALVSSDGAAAHEPLARRRSRSRLVAAV